jgi:hypothetical protein
LAKIKFNITFTYHIQFNQLFMRKILLSLFITTAFSGAFAQVNRYCLFEHFTQASCGPCAAQNPAFVSTIMTPNADKAREVAYHTSWPGTDPMYTYNSGGNGARTTFYGVTGVPSVTLMGNVKTGAPGAFNQNDVDGVYNNLTPLKIKVSEVDNGANRDVTVTVTSVGAPPSGTFQLYVAVIHRNAVYTTAPGSNGETQFPNVFRQMISGNPQTLPAGNANGAAITLAAQGNSVTMGPYNYLESLAINGATSELATVAWVQNTSTKEILQVGASWDGNGVMSDPTALVINGPASTPQTFNFTTQNSGGGAESFSYTLTSSAPAGWTGSFTVNGTPYTTTTTLSVPASTTWPVQIIATPSSTIGIGKYTLVMQSTTNPTSSPITKIVYVISGVTDLIVSNKAPLGTGSGSALTYESQFIAGLQYANNTTYAATDDNVFLRAMIDNALGQIKYVYWNVAWTNPVVSGDNLINNLTTFLNNGGCLFLSGQDIGWEIMDAAGTGTPVSQAFYTNFLNAAYLADGASTNTPITANASDAIFGTAGSNAVSTAVYTATNTFPDELNTAGIGQAIFYYNGNTAKKAGVRATNGTFKTVYLAVGIEQLATTASKNTILKISHDWFHLATGTDDFDNAMLALSLGQNYPNPASDHTFIPFTELNKDVTLQVVDLSGRILSESKVSKGTGIFKLNTSALEPGMYLYRISDGETTSSAKPLQVIR